MNLLNIETPDFLKELSNEELENLAGDIREFLIESVNKTGGHLASNLGMVELTMCLLKTFDLPNDSIIYDVGHQTYVHKILTGRAKDFPTLRQLNGLSGFPKRDESEYDIFETGHSSTSISLAAGLLEANKIKGIDSHVLAVIGDGALTGGMSFEALNYLGDTDHKVIVILNDNEYSISKNVGAMSKFLSSIRISKGYQKIKRFLPNFLRDFGNTLEYSLKGINIFESMGYDYYGPVDGHDFDALSKALKYAKDKDESIIVHVKTIKGKGLKPAEESAEKYHGISYFKIEKKEPGISWSEGIANIVKEVAPKNLRVITPAMVHGSGLKNFDSELIDVGIAEAHAATMASAMALEGIPVFLPLYSTFSQRAYDSIMHDISRTSAPVLIGIDRAGIVPYDGDTHQGVFDVGMFMNMPNFTVTMPRNSAEAKALIEYGFKLNKPFVIRYSKGSMTINEKEIVVEKPTWHKVRAGKKLTVISYGPFVNRVEKIIEENELDVELINAMFIKPLPANFKEMLSNENILVIEEVMESNSLGSILKSEIPNVQIQALKSLPNHGSFDDLLCEHSLDNASLLEEIKKLCV